VFDRQRANGQPVTKPKPLQLNSILGAECSAIMLWSSGCFEIFVLCEQIVQSLFGHKICRLNEVEKEVDKK
jgi:hypothetical protein